MRVSLMFIYTSVAVAMDLCSEKIDNRWILAGWFLGLFRQAFAGLFPGLGKFLLGAALPLVFLFPLFWFRMLGAGDIKLLSVLGGFLGPLRAAACVFYSFLCAAVLSAAILCFFGGLRDRLRYFTEYFQKTIQLKQRIPYRKPGRRFEHLHFSVAVLMAFLLGMGGFY